MRNRPECLPPFDTLFEQASNPILISDHQGKLLFANQSAQQTFRIPTPVPDTATLATYIPDLSYPDALQVVSHYQGNPIIFQVTRSQNIHQGQAISVHILTDITLRHNTEQNVWGTMARHAAIIDSVKDGIFTLDATGRVVSMNVAGEKIFGYFIGEVEDQPIAKLIPVFSGINDTESFEELINMDRSAEVQALHKEGYPFDIELSVRSFFLEGQHFYTAVVSDITDRKQVEEELDRHRDHLQEMVDIATREVRAIVDTAVNGVVTINEHGEILLFNPAAEEMFGWNANDILGKNVAILVPGIDERTHDGFIQHYLETRQASIIGIGREAEAQKKDGSLFPVRLAVGYSDLSSSGFSDKHNSQHLFVAFITDITEQKHAEQELIEAKNTAEQAALTKANFLANMSHEIRTPLNAIIGYSEVVHEDQHLNPSSRNHVRAIINSGKSLLNLINDILDFSKIEAGRISLEEVCFNLPNAIRDTLQTLEFKASEKKLNLNLEIAPSVPEKVMGDPSRLRQVVLNLAGNAIKFTEQGHVSITITTDKKPDFVHFCVSDTGIGMIQEQIDHVFEAFSQAEASTNRRFGGTGLGTTISKQIVEMMQGKIWIDSKINQGSQFHFLARLPEAPDNTPALYDEQETIQQHYRSPRVFNILLAEDLETNAELARLRLEQQGHRVTWVEDGKQAVAAITQDDFDIILMDVQMPEMDGLEATRLIRFYEQAGQIPHRESMTGNIPIIALTASILYEDKQSCLNVGMDDIVGKPVDFNELFQTMERLVPEPAGYLNASDPALPPHPFQSGQNAQDLSLLQDVIDYQTGLSTWGDADIYLKALTNFVRQQRHIPDKLASLLRQIPPDITAAERIAHSLKGVSGNLYITQVARICIQADQYLKDNQSASALPLCSELKKAIQTLEQSLSHYCKPEQIESIPQSPEQLKPETLIQLVDQIISAADELNPDAVMPYLVKLKGHCDSTLYRTLVDHTDQFDFDRLKQEVIIFKNSLDCSS